MKVRNFLPVHYLFCYHLPNFTGVCNVVIWGEFIFVLGLSNFSFRKNITVCSKYELIVLFLFRVINLYLIMLRGFENAG